MMRIAIAGATGRMGKMLIEAVLNCSDAELVGALEHESCPLLGEDAGAFLGKKTGVAITSDITKALSGAELLIDFTRPEGTMAHLAVAQKTGSKMIIGTTGLSPEQIESLKKASANLAIVFAPNMSVGVNATFKLLEIAAKMLNEGYDIEIIEAHHRHKVDAPSGTALRMGEVIADALGEKLDDVAVYAREGHTGERKVGSIGFATIRGGDIVVIIPSYLQARASVLRSAINLLAASLTRKVHCALHASYKPRTQACMTCKMFLACVNKLSKSE